MRSLPFSRSLWLFKILNFFLFILSQQCGYGDNKNEFCLFFPLASFFGSELTVYPGVLC
jgi:hypothetical protein